MAFSFDGNPTPVTYDPPSVIAGEPPLRISCTPASGSTFVLGSTPVTCNVTDAFLREATPCTFIVTLAVPPKISVTSFMAFGNSFTEGKIANGTVIPNSYPEDLRMALAVRYVSQTITMVTRGKGGESAVDGADRLPGELDTFHPQALLLEEGINDLLDGDPGKIQPMINALRDMVRRARDRGIAVFLGNMLPERPGGSRATALPLLSAANDQIRQVAMSERATLVDLYAGLGGNPDPYIDTDGLHPTEMGYQKIAQVFFDAIRTTLEVPASPASSREFVRNMPTHGGPLARLR